MGVSSSPLEFAGKMLRAGQALEETGKAGTERGALLMKRLILEKTPDHLSGVGKKGAKLGVRYTIGDYPDGAKALVFATGPFQLIERDTQPHEILGSGVGKVKGRRTKAAKHEAKQALYDALFGGTGGGFLGSTKRGFAATGPIHHPGSKGKHPFEHGVTEALPLIPKIYELGAVEHLARIF